MAIEIDWSVRRCFESDLHLVKAVHAGHAYRNPIAPSPTEAATWARMMATKDLIVYIAVHDGTPVGTATMILLPNITNECASTAFIEAVVVVPEHRRRGVARSMIEVALSDAGRAGCDKIQLLSHKRHSSDGAHALYSGLGFVAEAEGFRRYLLTPDKDRTQGPPVTP